MTTVVRYYTRLILLTFSRLNRFSNALLPLLTGANQDPHKIPGSFAVCNL